MITIFSFGDTIGRALAGLYPMFSPNSVIVLTTGRVLFIITAIFIQTGASPHYIFMADWFRILHIWLFAATNGYNTAAVMLYGPQQVEDKDKERAGLIMNFHLIGGV